MLPLSTLSLYVALLSPAAAGVLASPHLPIKLPILPAQGHRSSPSLTSRSSNGNGFIRASVHATHGAPKLRRRQEDEGLKNQNLGTTYTIDIDIGTPPQTVTLILDTGSPDLWVNPQCETSGQEKYCKSFRQFDYTKSKTIQDLGAADILRYGKGNVTIEYVTDDVIIGSAKIKSQILGIGFESIDIPLGILGLSPSVSADGTSPYPYLLDSMASQGIISSRAFSLDLRSIDNPSGAIIFGGVDLGKFSGSLAKLPMLDPSQTPAGVDRYWIVLSGVGMTYPDGEEVESEEIGVPVFLDSGGTLSRLPETIFQAIGDSFPGSQYDPESGFYIVDCSVAEQAGSVDFIFGSSGSAKKIRVPYGDFIWEVQTGVCVVGVLPTDDEPVFGDSFLRAAYVVFDQDNRNLHLAQAANCGEQIVEIGSGQDAVPSSTGKCKDGSAGATKTAGGGGLDVTATRAPTRTAGGSGPAVTNSDFGPGPAGTRVSTGGIGLPTGTGGSGGGGSGDGNGNDHDDSAASGLDVGVTAAAVLAGLNMLIVWLL
ncbi:aspartic peptidase domain-containing protein [Neurospora intermedia]|uniref:Aspartic peptidase domain-containing protein n=1 Tax=Neurospora intermedia TaxID=5142 RepID=A0ABR3DAD2_NEUIN